MNCTSRWSKFSLSTFVMILFLSGMAAGQCAANANGFTDTVIESGDQRPTDTVLNAYAAIFLDADPRAGSFCNGVAATHLRNKLTNTQNAGSHLDMLGRTVGPFAGWLEGAYVTYIFPAAIRLNQDGLLSSDQTLQNSLLWVANTYNAVATRANGTGPVVGLGSLDGCGLDATHGFSNTCMDDYSVAAAGFAWAAAYARMVNNPTLYGQLVDAAHFMIDKSYDTTQSICIVPNSVATNHDPQDMLSTNGRGPCTGTAQDLGATPSPQTGISVVAGTYGGNCGASHGNVTGSLASACNTLGRCDYIVDYTIIGDPAPGCAKDYVAEWTCNGQSLVQQATASPEAGFRKTVTLDCLPAQTFSLNHIGETPAYGFGLLTSISSAALGLRLAGSDHGFSSAEQYISKALAAEATRLTEPTGNAPPADYHFKNRPTLNDPEACPKIVPVGASTFTAAPQFQIVYPVNVTVDPDGTQHAAGGDCADAGYFPRMYPLSDFYSTFIGSPGTLLPLGFGAGLFNQDPNGHFGAGRQVYYGSLGWDARGSIMLPTAPLPPTPAYPADGTLHAPANFNLRWNSGVDASRRFPWWPVSYAVYYKAWPYGGVEPASYTLYSSGLPCNADSSGICNLAVSAVSDGNYRYYVVANMDESVPAGSGVLSTQSSTAYFTVGYQPISTIPAPLPPNPIYPSDGTLHVPGSFTLRWNSGLDASRISPFWPVTYAIYYKAWNYGTAEPAFYYFFGSGFQCNADFTGACTLPVANVANGNYRWYVVANMDVSASTGVPNSILSTQGSVAFFTIGYDAHVSISWIQPSARSWGPANTLTAAGFASGGVGGVTLQWRDVTLNGPWNTVAYQAPPDPTTTGWSNTIPSADNCHAFQATAQYTGVSATFNYDGVAQGYCSFRVIWIQPQALAGFGPPGSLVVAGSAQGGPPNAQVTLWFRDDTAQSAWMPLDFAPIPDSTGIWYNAVQNVDYTHQYSVYIVYDNRSSGSCSYFGNGSATTCP